MITRKPKEKKHSSIVRDASFPVQKALALFPFAIAVTTGDFRVVYQNAALSKKFNKSLPDWNHDKGILCLFHGSGREMDIVLSLKQAGRWSGYVQIMRLGSVSHFFLSCEPMLLGTAQKSGYVWSFMDSQNEPDTHTPPLNDGIFVSFKEITKKKKHELLSELEKKALAINSDRKSSLRQTLDIYLQGIGQVFPGLLCAVLTWNGDRTSLSHVSAPDLPADFCSALDGIPPSENPANGVYTKEKTIVADISTSPASENFRTVAAHFKLTSCWSIPVLDGQNNVLGILAVYCKDNRVPDEISTDLLDRAGKLVKVILENKQAEDELSIINERYLLATKATNNVIWDLDLKSGKLFWSEGFYTQFGFKSSDKINKVDFWEKQIHPDDRPRVMSNFDKFINQKENSRWQEEYRFKVANGKFIWIADRGFLMYDKDGAALRVIGSMQDVSLNRELAKKILKQELNKQKLVVQAVVDTQEKERAEIGKELHDNVNQILSTTKLYLEMAKNREEERMDLIERSIKNIHHAIDEIRNISRSLVPPSIGDLGLVAAIKDLVENIKAFKAIHVEFFAVGPIEKTISDQQKLMLFRIIQEQANNVLKHSETKTLVIELIVLKSENRIELNITDDGKGFEPLNIKHKKGLGLSNIVSRADLFGGRVSIVSAAGQGCKLTVQVPVSNL